MMRRRDFVGVAVAGAAGLTFANNANGTKAKSGGNIRPPDKSFLETLPKLMEIAQLPGVEIGVVQRGKPEWAHYEGFANADGKTPITAESIFPAASLGKQIFAY